MIPEILQKHKCTVEEFRKLATKAKYDDTDPFKKWWDRMADRIKDGIDLGVRDWRLYWAMDLAYDVPFHQTTETLVFDLFSGKLDEKEIEKAVKEMKLTHLMREEEPVDGDTKSKRKVLDVPVFFNIFVPLVKAYLTHRWGKIFNDRNVVPFFKFEPARFTTQEKLKGEIWTDVIQTVSNNMGTPARMRQAYFQTLHYGECMQFPYEKWYTEKYIDASGEKKVKRQGIRYHFPHPTRSYRDQAYPASSFNTDTGCKWAGYWQIMRWDEIRYMEDLYNTDKIAVGRTGDFFTDNSTYFRTVYPCQLRHPTGTTKQGAGEMDRERHLEYFNNTSPQDSSIIVTNHFEKVVPKDIGWGTYDCPIWVRVLVANDRDIIYAEPLCYTPVVYRGYDADENRLRNSSLTLDLLPFQDHLGNLLTHYILAVKQNLETITFYDTEQLSETQMKAIRNLGHSRYSKRNFIPKSSREDKFADVKGKAIEEAEHRNHNTFEVMTAVRVMIEVMERSLGYSTQEVGQPASHEQSAQEVRVISDNTGNRLQFTASFIDDGDFATQRQQYDAYLAYGDDEVFAQVTLSENDKAKKKAITDMGLEIEEYPASGEPKAGVRGKKGSIVLDSFINYRNSGNRSSDAALVTAMSQLVQALIANPNVFASIGAKQTIEIWNMMARMSGLFPRDFEVHAVDPAETPEGQAMQAAQLIPQIVQAVQQMQQQLQAMPQAIMEQVGQAVMPMTEEINGLKQADVVIVDEIQKIQQVIATAAAAPTLPQAQAMPVMPPTPEEVAAELSNAIPQGAPVA